MTTDRTTKPQEYCHNGVYLWTAVCSRNSQCAQWFLWKPDWAIPWDIFPPLLTFNLSRALSLDGDVILWAMVLVRLALLMSIPSCFRISLSLMTSSFSSLISLAFGSSLTIALHTMLLARSAYLRYNIYQR